MFNQLDMVLKLLPEYAERAASKLLLDNVEAELLVVDRTYTSCCLST
jgi:hypothetical protein